MNARFPAPDIIASLCRPQPWPLILAVGLGLAEAPVLGEWNGEPASSKWQDIILYVGLSIYLIILSHYFLVYRAGKIRYF
jgi:hypothetical protein